MQVTRVNGVIISKLHKVLGPCCVVGVALPIDRDYPPPTTEYLNTLQEIILKDLPG